MKVAIRNDDVQMTTLDRLFQQGQGIAGHADEPAFPLGFQAVQDFRRVGKHSFVIVRKFNVVGEQDVDMIGLQATQGAFKTFPHPCWREIEFRPLKPSRFRANAKLLPQFRCEDLTEDLFRFPEPVKGGRVDQVDPSLGGEVQCLTHLVVGNRAILLPDGGSAKGELGDEEAGLAEGAEFQDSP